MGMMLNLYWLSYTWSIIFSIIVTGCLIWYLVQRGRSAGEWWTSTSAGAALVIYAIAVFKGTRVLVAEFQVMAVTGTGGVSPFAAALGDTRIAVVIGGVLALIMLLVSVVLSARPKMDAPPSQPGSSGALLCSICCTLLLVFLMVLDYHLPNYILDASFTRTGLSFSQIANGVASRIFLLTTTSVVAGVVGMLIILLPLILRVSRPIAVNAALRTTSFLMIVLLVIHTGLAWRQAVRFCHIAITGQVPGSTPPVEPKHDTASQEQGEPQRITQEMQQPRLISKVEPDYPEAARRARIQGIVIAEAVITATGNVENVRILRGVDPQLDKAAEQAILQWKYLPAQSNGRPVAVYFTVTINFSLR